MKKILFTILFCFICNFAFGAAATMYVTSAGAGTKLGNDWDNAMGEAEFETDIEGNAEAGDIYYVAGGTYTLDSDIISTKNGTAASPIFIIGVVSGTTNEPPVYSDWAFGDNRPLLTDGGSTYYFRIGTYVHVYNLRLQSNRASVGFSISSYCVIFNCKSTNTAGGPAFADYYGSRSRWLYCEGICSSGYAFVLTQGYESAIYCYAHDSTGGFFISYSTELENCIVDTCTTGLGLQNYDHRITGNTFYNCTTGISGGTSSAGHYVNNIIDSCTTGASWTSEVKDNFWDYNAWGNNTSDTSNVTKGNNAVTQAGTFLASGAGGDFTVAASSAVLDAGLQPDTNLGVTGDYKWNIGVDQDDNTAAGGGGSPIGWVAISQ